MSYIDPTGLCCCERNDPTKRAAGQWDSVREARWVEDGDVMGVSVYDVLGLKSVHVFV